MEKSRMASLFCAGIMAVSCGAPQTSLTEILAEASESHCPLFGHQDTYMYGHDWNSSDGADNGFTRSDVYSTSGRYPAIFGIDLGHIELGDELNLDGNNFEAMRKAAVAHHERGGIVEVTWHLDNPVTGGSSWDVSDTTVVARILEGGDMHAKFMEWTDRVCDWLSSVKDAHGNAVPMIWRPFHEHTGGWFWWGSTCCSSSQYNALWKMLHEYMTTKKGLDNLLWAISPASNSFGLFEERYPGDGYVDLIGVDHYEYKAPEASQQEADEIFIVQTREILSEVADFAKAHGKLYALTETGCESLPTPAWWTTVLSEAIKDSGISYVLLWRNSNREDQRQHFYVPFAGQQGAGDFLEFVMNGKVKMIEIEK